MNERSNEKDITKDLEKGYSNSSKNNSSGGKKTKKDWRNKRRDNKRFSYGKGKAFNDVAWYTKNPGITSAFTKIPFNHTIGTPVINLEGQALSETAVVSFIVDWMTSVTPVSVNTSCQVKAPDRDILDQVATIIYASMRRANSGSTNNIQHVDPMISNLIASIDIMCNAVYIKRIFKLAASFSWKNRTVPKILFNLMNIDYEDFIANQANYRGRYNMMVAKARTIRTLAGYPFLNAAMAQYENVFKDSDSETGREQLIIGIKAFHHIYHATGSDRFPGGCVRIMCNNDLLPGTSGAWKPIFTAKSNNQSRDTILMKFSVLLDILDVQINTLITDNDFNLIQADIEKAFGENSGYMVIDSIEDNVEPLKPVYSGEFNNMFHNGMFYPMHAVSGQFPNDSIAPGLCVLDKGTYVNDQFQMMDSARGEVSLCSRVSIRKTIYGDTIYSPIYGNMIDSESEDPTTEDIILSTRYKSIVGPETNGPKTLDWSDLVPEWWKYDVATADTNRVTSTVKRGSNFLTFGHYVVLINTEEIGEVLSTYVTYVNWFNTNTYNTSQGLRSVLSLQNSPLIFADSSYTNAQLFLSDHNNFRIISDDELRGIHEACFYSLWDLPAKTNID